MQPLPSNQDIFGETAHGESMKFQSHLLFGHNPNLPTNVFGSPGGISDVNSRADKDFRMTGFSRKAKIRLLRAAPNIDKAASQNP